MDNLDLAQLRALHAAAIASQRGEDCQGMTDAETEFYEACEEAFPAILDRLETAERERDNALRYTDLLISERDKSKKIAIDLIASFASVRDRNTTEWMQGITDDINAALELIGDNDRVVLKRGMLFITQAARLRREAGIDGN